MYTPNTIDRFVGRNMRARRQELGMTPEALAVLLSVEVDTVRRFESGEERIRPPVLFTLAKRLHVGVGYFFQDASTRRTAEVIPPAVRKHCLTGVEWNSGERGARAEGLQLVVINRLQ